MPDIDSSRLYAELERETFHPVYWLAGENVYERDRAVEKIKAAVNPDDFNYDVFYGDRDDGAAIVQAASSAPVFVDRRMVLVRRAGGLKADSREAIAAYLQNPLETTCLVFVAGGGEGRQKGPRGESISKLASKCGASVEFEPPSPQSVQKWAAAYAKKLGANLSPQAAQTLEESVGGDMFALENEIAKLAAYKNGAEITPHDALECLGFTKEENPFELSNAISSNNGALAMRIIDKELAAGGEPIALLAMMAKYAERMLRVKLMVSSGMAQNQIAAELGVKPYYVSRLAAESRMRSERALSAALNKLLEADSALKTSSGNPAAMLKSIALVLSKPG